jgi:hypothetical protein
MIVFHKSDSKFVQAACLCKINSTSPHCYTEECTELLQQDEAEKRLMKLITKCDETWVYGYDVETKQQS